MAALSPNRAWAQSPADVATARQLATEGIDAYSAGDAEVALDRLARAQALYDAPVHELYIARSLHKLGRLIEASETYRKLLRRAIPSAASDAAQRAVEEAKRELEVLEPKIPSVTITTVPDRIGSLALRIDDEPVSAAVVGVPRLVDPGTHTVRATAPGLKAASATVDVAEGEHQRVQLNLRPTRRSGAASSDQRTEPPTRSRKPATKTRSGGSEPKGEARTNAKRFTLYVGLGLGGALPGGAFYNDENGEAVEVADHASGGIGGGLEVGVGFARYFGVSLLVDSYSLDFSGLPGVDSQSGGLGSEHSGRAQQYGISFWARTRPGVWGGFAEVGLARDSWTHTFDVTGPSERQCSITDTLSGTSVRVGGGGIVPVTAWLEVSPFVMLSAGNFDSRELDVCPAPPVEVSIPDERTFDSPQQAGHTLILLGVGGAMMWPLF